MRCYIVKTPPTDGMNSFYVSNRPPLAPSSLVKLPIGSITPRGWLRHMLELDANGTVGHLPELSRACKMKGSAWASPEGEGHEPWETFPYWFKGFGDLGYVLKAQHIINEASKWIEVVLSNQEEDGWFGPRSNKTLLDGNPDLWPNMIMLNALQSYYEVTGDKRILPFMLKYFRWQLSVPKERFLVPFWQKMRAGDNLATVYWLYNRTGEKWLLDIAKKVHQCTANWTEGIASWHGVNISQCFYQPALFYMQAKDTNFIQAAERNYDMVMGLYGQVPGGMFGADENCRPGYGDPRQAAETCTIVELMHSFETLVKITGNPLWADRCEEVAFNSFPVSRMADLKALHYFTAPNMIQLDRGNKAPGFDSGGCQLSYDPWRYRCCQHNVSQGWPYYAEELWLATPDDGLCASLYSASEVKARVGDGTTVTIVETTGYPFSETVAFTLSTPKQVRFPLYLRIPRWCEGANIRVNNQFVNAQLPPLTYAVIEREWTDGDTVVLQLPMRITVTVWKANKNSVSVNRGPITFSLKIGERWERYATPETDKWPAYEVYPTTPWNYGLALDPVDPASSFEVVEKLGPLADQPFTPEAAPIELRAKAKRIPQWKQDELGLVGELPQSPVQSDEPIETVTLIPMGCARLRISAFPIMEVRIPDIILSTGRVSASRMGDDGTGNALNDHLEPSSSADLSVPRFTWWPRWPFVSGGDIREWVQYDFNQVEVVSAVEVYWFDDTEVGGECRLPKSWRLLYKHENEFKPVTNASIYGVEKDKYNNVTFDPVATSALRLEVELPEGFFGGILEWRVIRAK